MDNSIYVALSRQTMLQRQMAQTANNVANANTTAFKTDKMIFEKYLMDAGVSGKLAFTHDRSSYRDIEDGPIQITHRPFDVAIKGEGYFKVKTPLGERYTRDGSFQKDVEGRLTTGKGHLVLSPGGAEIVIPPQITEFKIGENGSIYSDGNQFAQIGVFQFDNSYDMKKFGNGLYTTEQEEKPAENYRVVQGGLEGSNVNSVTEMVRLIEVSRGVGSIKNLMDTVSELKRDTVRRLTQK